LLDSFRSPSATGRRKSHARLCSLRIWQRGVARVVRGVRKNVTNCKSYSLDAPHRRDRKGSPRATMCRSLKSNLQSSNRWRGDSTSIPDARMPGKTQVLSGEAGTKASFGDLTFIIPRVMWQSWSDHGGEPFKRRRKSSQESSPGVAGATTPKSSCNTAAGASTQRYGSKTRC
jgi:hypothetical protein